MEIKNLSQMKKAIAAKTPFTIIKHYLHPECDGQVRVPNVVQTNGFYSVEKDKPDSPVSVANDGKGYWIGYGKASDWSFAEGLCTQSISRNGRAVLVWSISF